MLRKSAWYQGLLSVSLLLASCQPALMDPAPNHPSANPAPTASPSASPAATPETFEAQVLASDDQPVTPPDDAELERLLSSDLVARYNAMGFKLFQAIFAKEGHQKNILISPLSIMLAMAMAYNGAAGETRAQIAKVLELEGFSIAEFNELSSILWRSLVKSQSESLHVQIANSIWADKQISLRPEFIAQTQAHYQAQMAALDFRFEPEQSADVINDWISKRTNGLIPQVISHMDVRQAILFLVNTVYFKASWEAAFTESLTQEKDFFLSPKQVVQAPMMSISEYVKYLQHAATGTQIIQKPFNPVRADQQRRLHNYAMTFILPDEKQTLQQEVKQLDEAQWLEWSSVLAKNEKKNGFIRLPRFEAGYGILLEDYFYDFGMTLPFDFYKANFHNMLSGKTSISKILHRTKIKMDETGTEAAAVTIIVYEFPNTNRPSIDFEFEANRPFLYLIHDLNTGLVLFVGSLINPLDKGE